MTRADNSDHLRRAAADRHDTTLDRTHAALEQLDRTGQPITIASVARTAHVSRSWLYDQPDLRALITRLAISTTRAARSPGLPAAQRANVDSLRQRLDAARIELSRLRAENMALRDQLGRHLGQQRAAHR